MLHKYLTINHLCVYGPRQLTHYLTLGNPDVLDIAVGKDIVCPVEVSILMELSSDHCHIQVHMVTQYLIMREARQVAEWNR